MDHFLQELRRRRVVRVAVMYCAGVFALLQAADIVGPRVGIADGAVTVVFLVGLLGLPAVLWLAWSFDLTGDGIQRTPRDVDPAAPLPSLVGRWTALGATGLVTLGLAGVWLIPGSDVSGREDDPTPAAAADAAIRSVAVIPFVNSSPDRSNEYFSDGLSEELLNVLAQVEGLKVAARTSSWAFKGRSADVKEIAAALGVQAVVEGSVRKDRDRVRVTAQLVQASDGFQLWSDSYDGHLEDVFALQDSLAEAIGQALRVTLGIGALTRLERGMTEDLAAYELYLLGRHRWAQRTPAGIADAIGYYEEALARDSTFALAWSGLADAHVLRSIYDFEADRASGLAAARQASARALALTPDRPEALASAGFMAFNDWRFDEALALLDRAVEAAPGYSWTHQFRWQVLAALGRYQEAMEATRTLYELDPLSPVVLQNLASALDFAGRPEEALAFAERSTALSEPAPYWIAVQGGLLVRLGRYDEAREAFYRWAEALGYPHPERTAVVAGPPGAVEAAAIQALLDDVAARTSAGRPDLISGYVEAGPDAFLEVATEAVDTHHFWAAWLNVFGQRSPELQRDPRFHALLRRVGLPVLGAG